MARFNWSCTGLISLFLAQSILFLAPADSRLTRGSFIQEGASHWQGNAMQNKPMPPVEPPGLVGGIQVLGNDATPDGLILDQLQLYPGARYTKKDLQLARRKLARLGLFDSCKVSAAEAFTDSPFKTIIVTLQERSDANYRLKIAEFLRSLHGEQVGGLTAAQISDAGRLIDRSILLLQYLYRLCSTTPQSSSSP
jgi:Surface antigen variable number repeat